MNKKIIAIGDIHGRRTWQQIIENHPNHDIVFIGDYFDSFEYLIGEQCYNFLEIVSLKKQYPDRVTLLFGNHDYHYLRGVDQRYPGYQAVVNYMISELIHEYLHLMQMCYVVEDIIFSHAGISKYWLRDNNIEFDINTLEDEVNDLFKYKPLKFGFTPGRHFDNYGDEVCQTPIWIRPKSLALSLFPGTVQIVGHTHYDELTISPDIILIDALPYEYLEIDLELENEERFIRRVIDTVK